VSLRGWYSCVTDNKFPITVDGEHPIGSAVRLVDLKCGSAGSLLFQIVVNARYLGGRCTKCYICNSDGTLSLSLFCHMTTVEWVISLLRVLPKANQWLTPRHWRLKGRREQVSTIRLVCSAGMLTNGSNGAGYMENNRIGYRVLEADGVTFSV
jgi:hypothetical protein